MIYIYFIMNDDLKPLKLVYKITLSNLLEFQFG
jgi:hypothetical protein